MDSHKINIKGPQILSLAASRVGEWSESSWKWLSRLRVALLQRFHDHNRLSSKTMRSDQRIAISQLLKIMLNYLDLNTINLVLEKEKRKRKASCNEKSLNF